MCRTNVDNYVVHSEANKIFNRGLEIVSSIFKGLKRGVDFGWS